MNNWAGYCIISCVYGLHKYMFFVLLDMFNNNNHNYFKNSVRRKCVEDHIQNNFDFRIHLECQLFVFDVNYQYNVYNILKIF